LVFLELGVAGDRDTVGGFIDSPADVDDVAVFVLQLFGRGEATVGQAPEQEDFAGPGTGDDVLDAIAVESHKLRTKADASARWDAALLLARLELHSGRVSGLSVRADVLVEPQNALAELADEQILLAVAIEIDNERCRV